MARRTWRCAWSCRLQRQAGHPLTLRTARLLAKHKVFGRGGQDPLRLLAVEALTRAKDVDQLRSADWLGLEPADRRDAHPPRRPAWLPTWVSTTTPGLVASFLGRLNRLCGMKKPVALAGALPENIRGIGGDWLQRLNTGSRNCRDAELALAGQCLRELRPWGKSQSRIRASH